MSRWQLGAEVAEMSLQRLNELLAHVLDEMGHQGLTIVTKDDAAFKPWPPESYWAKEAHLAKVNEGLARTAIRMAEDQQLADAVSVTDVLEADIPTLWQPEHDKGWGTTPMKRAGGVIRPPHRDDPQPSYCYQCFQCGRPITVDGRDHGGKYRCDLALLDQETIDHEDYWTDHKPKPPHGEEEDDDEGDW